MLSRRVRDALVESVTCVLPPVNRQIRKLSTVPNARSPRSANVRAFSTLSSSHAIFVAEKYGALIDALYSTRTVQHVETQVKFEDGRTGMVAADLNIVEAKTFAANAAKAAA